MKGRVGKGWMNLALFDFENLLSRFLECRSQGTGWG
jgi:hypothetical protein